MTAISAPTSGPLGVLEPLSDNLFAALMGADRGPLPILEEDRVTEALLADRGRVIDAILAHNHTATSDWLDGFNDAALAEYLRRLESAARPRGRQAVWRRTGDRPAMIAIADPEA